MAFLVAGFGRLRQTESSIGRRCCVKLAPRGAALKAIDEPAAAAPQYEFKKVRQHVNPLASRHQREISVSSEWPGDVFVDVKKPLHVDIGSASGGFALQMAADQPDWNFLGLEIRTPLVERAKHKLSQRGMRNLDFIYSNANVNLETVLSRFPKGVLQRVTVLFPDPWFKKRQHKRRVVQPELVNTVAKYLALDGEVVLHSDILETAEAMRDYFKENSSFHQIGEDWESDSTFPFMTERESLVSSEGGSVFRVRFRRV